MSYKYKERIAHSALSYKSLKFNRKAILHPYSWVQMKKSSIHGGDKRPSQTNN